MKFALLAVIAAYLVSCITSNGKKESNEFRLKSLSGFVYAHKGGAVVDSFLMDDSIRKLFLDSVDHGFLGNIRIKIAADSFRADISYSDFGRKVDSVITGPVTKTDSAYFSLIESMPCGNTYDGIHKTYNSCFRKSGSTLEINACADFLYDDTTFQNRAVDFASVTGMNNMIGLKCSERAYADPRMHRLDLKFIFE